MPFRLPVSSGIHLRIHCLRPSLGRNLRISHKQVLNLSAICFIHPLSELPVNPLLRILPWRIQIADPPGIIIIRQIEEKGQRILHTEQIPHVHDPKLPDSALVSGSHLFPYLRKIGRVHPFVGNGPAVIIKMVIHTKPAVMLSHMLCGDRAQVAEIVIAKHQCYPVKLLAVHQTFRLIITIIKRLHFLIKCQHSRHLFKIGIHTLTYQLILAF